MSNGTKKRTTTQYWNSGALILAGVRAAQGVYTFSTLPRDAYNNVEALVHIHPFLDGNGRTARLLMNYIQAYYRLSLGLIFEEDKQSYYAALQSVQEHGDHEHYYAFMFAQYEKYLKGEINRANP